MDTPLAIDWTKIQKKYAEQWVAFKNDEKTVVAAHKTLRGAYKKAQQEGCARPMISFMPYLSQNGYGILYQHGFLVG